jgi:methylmalonyl-CoA/ethylmalonyl-CoA epimerase
MNASFGNVRQLGYVVEALDEAIAAWSRKLGLGPWTIIRNVPLQMTYLGKQSQPVIDVALAFRGDVQIELIQQKNEAASPYRGFIEERRFGLHHIAFLVDDANAEIARAQHQGLELVCDIRMPTGGRYVYFKSPAPGETTFIEFLENNEQMKQMFAQGITAAAGWNGEGEPMVIDFAAMAGSS